MSKTTSKRSTASDLMVELRMDTITLDRDVGELVKLARSLEDLVQRVRSMLERLPSDQTLIRVGKPTLRAGHLICRPQIRSRNFELLRSALRTLNIDVAHEILNKIKMSNKRSTCVKKL